MSANDNPDPGPVYQTPPTEGRPRAFYVDVWDEDTDVLVHAYYGATHPVSGAIARSLHGSSFHSLQDVERFADRVGGVVTWC
jgi:hypothetical protein